MASQPVKGVPVMATPATNVNSNNVNVNNNNVMVNVAGQPSTTTRYANGSCSLGNVGLFDACCASGLCCVGCCCPCCVVGANRLMLETGQVVDPCAGGGGICCLHGIFGGAIQGILIWEFGPLASLAHFGSCVGCAFSRTALRKKYGLEENCFGDWCIWYWCGPCAVTQEYEEIRTRILQGNATPTVSS